MMCLLPAGILSGFRFVRAELVNRAAMVTLVAAAIGMVAPFHTGVIFQYDTIGIHQQAFAGFNNKTLPMPTFGAT